MEENYIHIYTSYISDLFQDKQLSFQEVRDLLQDFLGNCKDIKDRQGLVNFLNSQIPKFPQLEQLKTRLLDEKFVFPPVPKEEE